MSANDLGISKSKRRKIFHEENLTCALCGAVGREERFPNGGYGYYVGEGCTGIYLSIDHIIPKSKGGSHGRSNLRCLCTTCNTKKGVKIT